MQSLQNQQAMPDLLLQDFNPDWELLRKQKIALQDASASEDDEGIHELLEGIVSLIDCIQDQAVSSGIWEESEVFGEEQEDQYFEWEEKYKPIQNHIDTNASYSGAMFETFGEELEYIRAYPDQKNVWTLLEADGKHYISAGYHIVNRFGYFITEIAWETGTEEFYSE